MRELADLYPLRLILRSEPVLVWVGQFPLVLMGEWTPLALVSERVWTRGGVRLSRVLTQRWARPRVGVRC